MSFRVRLLPSGKEFTAEKNETVLEAALRSGISLNYSCNNGSCGGCGGRIKSGQVRETQQHDFHFSDTQKAQGHVLLCVNAAQSDLEIEVKEAGGIEDIPRQLIPTKVEQMERVQDDTMILHLRTPRRRRYAFSPGSTLASPSRACRHATSHWPVARATPCTCNFIFAGCRAISSRNTFSPI